MSLPKIESLVAGVLMLCAPGMLGTALGAPIGYQFTISGDPNEPDFKLTNTSQSASLVGFSLTIGDTTRNWDSVHSFTISDISGAPLTPFLASPDQMNDGLRSDEVRIGFTGFNRGDSFAFAGDIDLGNANTPEDYRTVLFSNGPSENAVLSVVFSGQNAPVTLSTTLSDQPLASSYAISQWQLPSETVNAKINQVNARRQAVAEAKDAASRNPTNMTLSPNISPVPVPPTLPLMASAVAVFAFFRRSRTG